MFKVDLTVSPRPGVMDPQAEAVEESLGGLGYDAVKVHAVGRRLSMTLDVADEARDQLVRFELETGAHRGALVADDPRVRAPIDLAFGR